MDEGVTTFLALLAAPAEFFCIFFVTKALRSGGVAYYSVLGLMLPVLVVFLSLRAGRRSGSVLRATWSRRGRWVFGIASLLVLGGALLAFPAFAPVSGHGPAPAVRLMPGS